MARRKPFNVHDLYPADYCFNWEAFEADPERYVFTKDDIAYSNAMELEKYEQETPMTPYEKRALRRWVASGHSVMETPPSRYACIHCCYPPPSFLDVYREDKQLDAATRGMTKSEKASYLKEYVGFPEESAEERAQREANQHLHEQTPEAAREVIRTLQRKIFYLSTFLAEQGLSSEAEDYLSDHMDTPALFEDEW
jgi:hypothetical protein